MKESSHPQAEIAKKSEISLNQAELRLLQVQIFRIDGKRYTPLLSIATNFVIAGAGLAVRGPFCGLISFDHDSMLTCPWVVTRVA